MAKKPSAQIKLQVPAGGASPAVGTALGPHGLNIGEFIKTFNEMTSGQEPLPLPTTINVFEKAGKKSFTITVNQPPVAVLIKKAIGLAKGSGTPNTDLVGQITREQMLEIAERKMVDMNATDVEAALRIIAGTARSMGVQVIDNLNDGE